MADTRTPDERRHFEPEEREQKLPSWTRERLSYLRSHIRVLEKEVHDLQRQFEAVKGDDAGFTDSNVVADFGDFQRKLPRGTLISFSLDPEGKKTVDVYLDPEGRLVADATYGVLLVASTGNPAAVELRIDR